MNNEKKTFTNEKRKWKEKNTKVWPIDLKLDDYEETETLRKETGLSRPAFLRMLVENYKQSKNL